MCLKDKAHDQMHVESSDIPDNADLSDV